MNTRLESTPLEQTRFTTNRFELEEIPENIKKSVRELYHKTAPDSDFLIELEKKLDEELKECQESKSIEELADILEIILRISEIRGKNKAELEVIQNNKRITHGGFEKNFFLLYTLFIKKV